MMIVKVPGIHAFGKTQGCRQSDNAVISELRKIRSNEKGKLIDVNLLNIEETHVNNENLEEQDNLIYNSSKEKFKTQDKVLFLGGDHSISYSTGRAFLEVNNKKEKESCLIVFDAHADCDDTMKEPSHEEWLRALIERGFPAENILLVGVREMSQNEVKFLSEKGIKRISINQIEENIQEMADVITEFAHGKELYVSLDIDVVDPAFALSTNHPVAGGLTSRQMIYLVQRIALMKNLRGFDIVEIDSEKDKDGRTVGLGARIVAELL